MDQVNGTFSLDIATSYYSFDIELGKETSHQGKKNDWLPFQFFSVKFPHAQWQILSKIAFESLVEVPFNFLICLRFKKLCGIKNT